MAWFILISSGVLEAVWATALGKSDGLTKLVPSIIFLVTMIISLLGLAYAMKTLPTGTSYAIWTAVGATLAVVYGMATGAESISTIKVLLLIGLVGCIAGLQVVA